MADLLYQYPLLSYTENGSTLQQLQSTLTALRELYNNRNAVNTNLPWGQLDGCCFGVAELQGLLTKVHREVSKLNNHDPPDDRAADVTRRIHEAMTSTDPVREMAAVVRWANDVCIDFLYLDPKLVTAKARWGLEIMEDVKNRLHAYWSEVSGTIERNDLWDEYPSRTLIMRKILCQFLRRLYDHHTQVPDSRVGLGELLLIGEEIDFVERDIYNNAGIHHLFTQLTQDGRPMVQRVQAIGQMIRQKLKEYGQPMPLEYAIAVVARIFPKLDSAVMESLPLDNWAARLNGIGLNEIADMLRADVAKALASAQAGPPPAQSTSDNAVSAWMNNASTGGPRSELGSDGQNIVDQLQAAFDKEPSVASPFNSLFDPDPTPVQKTLLPPGTFPPNWKLALPPGGIYEGCTPKNKTRKKLSMSDYTRNKARKTAAPPPPALTGGALLTGNLHKARTPSNAGSATHATPAVSESSRFTGHATPAAWPALGIPTMYHRPQLKKQSFTSTGMAERAAETSARLRGARGQGVKGPKKQILSPMPSVLEEPGQRSVDTSVVDDDGDSNMDAVEDEPVQTSAQASAQPSVVDNEGDSKMGDEEDDEEDDDEEGEEEGGWVPPEPEPTSEEE